MFSNEKGYALPLVLIVMIVFILLSTALWHFGTAETVQVARAENRAKAHYLARSGLSVTERVLEEETEKLLVDNDSSFYLYGSLDNANNGSLEAEWELSYNNYDSEDILVEVKWDGLEGGIGSGTVVSRGHYLEVEEIIERDFFYVFMQDGGSLGWYKTTGGAMVMPGGSIGEENMDVDGPVLLSDDGKGIIAQHNAPTGLSATAMYFIDEPDSFIIKKNADRLELITNQIYLDGNVIFEGGNENITLTTRSEEVFVRNTLQGGKEYLEFLNGDKVNEIEFDNYGFLYLGAQEDEGVNYDANIVTGDGERIHEHLGPGYYFFPDLEGGLKLGKEEHLHKLLRITDINAFDLKVLSPGLVFGLYR